VNNYQDDWIWLEDDSVWDTLMDIIVYDELANSGPAELIWTMSGGATWGGWGIGAVSNTFTMSGGATFGGADIPRTKFNWASSPAQVFGGSATATYKSPRFYPSGGAVWNGAATLSYTPSNNIVIPENPNHDKFTAWAVNYQTGAVSRYDAMPATSCCFFKGVLYVTNVVGVYAVDNISDQGVNINSSVDFGMTDFGQPEDKRVPAIYLGASSNGTLAVNARTNIGEMGYFGMDLSPAGWHGSRATLGRGIQARYWQFRVVSINGATVEIDALSLDPLILKRRGV
jgi:hypothetical protein